MRVANNPKGLPTMDAGFSCTKILLAYRVCFFFVDRSGESLIITQCSPPGAGKSFAVSHVISCLEDQERAYYFFRHDDPLASSLSGVLRAIAVQMASVDSRIQQSLLDVQKNYPNLDKMDFRIIWQKIFVGAILTVPFDKP